jgi:hypothetical protein
VPLKAFDQNGGWHTGRPKPLLTKRNNQCQRIPRMLGQSADAPRIQDQHEASAHLALGTTCRDSLRDGRRLRSLPRRRLT